MTIEYEIRPLRELDGRYLEASIWTRDLTSDEIEDAIVCQAFDAEGWELGVLSIAGDGKILIVEVVPERRRQGIATTMLRTLIRAGYRPRHDWANMRDDGAAWAHSLENVDRTVHTAVDPSEEKTVD